MGGFYLFVIFNKKWLQQQSVRLMCPKKQTCSLSGFVSFYCFWNPAFLFSLLAWVSGWYWFLSSGLLFGVNWKKQSWLKKGQASPKDNYSRNKKVTHRSDGYPNLGWVFQILTAEHLCFKVSMGQWLKSYSGCSQCVNEVEQNRAEMLAVIPGASKMSPQCVGNSVCRQDKAVNHTEFVSSQSFPYPAGKLRLPPH